jgi:hypothetical protein
VIPAKIKLGNSLRRCGVQEVKMEQRAERCRVRESDAGNVLGGDLNPVLGFCFPLFSIVLPGGIAISVENSGM